MTIGMGYTDLLLSLVEFLYTIIECIIQVIQPLTIQQSVGEVLFLMRFCVVYQTSQ